MKIEDWEQTIITDSVFENLYNFINSLTELQMESNDVIYYIHNISIQYNIDKKSLLLRYYNWILRNRKMKITADFLKKLESIVHNNGDVPIEILILQSKTLIIESAC